MEDAEEVESPTADGADAEATSGTEADAEPAELSLARFVLSMAVSVAITLVLVGAMAYGLWALLPSPFGLVAAVILLGGGLLGNALVVRRHYERWRLAGSDAG